MSADRSPRRRVARPSRRTIGTVMVVNGWIGVLLALACAVIGLQLVGGAKDAAGDSLEITADGLDVVADSIDVTTSVVAGLRTGLRDAATTLRDAERTMRDAGTVLTDATGVATGPVPDAVDAVVAVLPTIEDAASSIDTALRALSRVPFGPDYSPTVPIDTAIGDLRAALEPLPDELRSSSGGIAALSASLADTATSVGAMADAVDELTTQLDDVTDVLDRSAATAAEAKALAARSRGEVDRGVSSTRWVLVLLALTYGAGQIVPLWLGGSLRDPDGDGGVRRSRHDGGAVAPGGAGTGITDRGT